jgi:hypothetical protein
MAGDVWDGGCEDGGFGGRKGSGGGWMVVRMVWAEDK